MIAITILTLIVLLKITRIMLNLKIKIQILHLIIILTRITIAIIIINPQGLEILGQRGLAMSYGQMEYSLALVGNNVEIS